MKKYELIPDDKIEFAGKTLYRIKACKDFTLINGVEIHAGDMGGYIEKEENLSQVGKAWVYDNGSVCDNGLVCGNGCVCDSGYVGGDGIVCDSGIVGGNGCVGGNAFISCVNDLIRVSPVDKYARALTLFKTRENEIRVCYMHDVFSIEEFVEYIKDWDEKYKKVAIAAVEMAKGFIDLTKSEEDRINVQK